MSVKDLIDRVLVWEGELKQTRDRNGKRRNARDIELGRALGVSPAQIHRLRNGKSGMSIEMLQKIIHRYKKSWSVVGKLFDK